MHIDINEHENTKTDVYLMDGKKIVEYKVSLYGQSVKDFVINVTTRYDLSKDTVVNNGSNVQTLDEYVRR